VNGTFTKKSNQHYYSFPGNPAKATTFNLAGEWPASLGAAVFVTDGNYKVLAQKLVGYGSKASVEVKFASDSKHFVFAAPLKTYKGQKPLPYSLNAACAGCVENSECGSGEQCVSNVCTARPLCVQVEHPSGKFIAKNFQAGQYAEANDWATKTAEGGAFGISLATCTEVGSNTACPRLYAPVCGVSTASNASQTYGNQCEFKAGIVRLAGDFGEVAAIASQGACAAPGNPQCATYTVQSDDTRFAYYAQNWNSAAEANSWIALNPQAIRTQVYNGACNAFTACTREYMPVCGGVKSEDDRTFSNRCGLEVAVRVDAGDASWSKGRYTTGGTCN
jgi:hypothetical protein